MRAGVAFGSNVGDRLGNMQLARKAVMNVSGVTPPILSSAIYETDPVECEPDAAEFLNAVMEFGYEGAPLDLLHKLRQIERSLGRPADHARNVSRSIDIDFLYLAGVKYQDEELQLPHPRMRERAFVLVPLAEIRPDLVLPDQTQTVQEMLASLSRAGKVMRLTEQW
jgi:2-amino-4-hydroxy-6-hydroxymethyldihydropteridine diphosphokinase